MTDYDPRIIDLYDEDNPDGPDHDYYRSLASLHRAQRILDLGCGTGILTVSFADGRDVVGVDPSPTMISYARQRSGADHVTWVEGYSSDVAEGPFDLIVMTGNVAQHIPDPQWERTLKDLRRLASDGGVLAFESRNPSIRAWEIWAAEEPTTRNTMFGEITEWCVADELDHGQVLLRSFNRFESTKEVVEEDLLLTFRDDDLLMKQLVSASFEVSAIWGDWDRTVFDGSQGVMVFEARAV
ncbi:class I SAM-dependent methyltransferase [Neomicrococcus lactis]|uniref:SAM-dependent methyltransferase n=1 Tax=Neomicrococcus lactis TaxID=732241 RepID=A0A7W9DA10_9MICC|nr:class I SAM-dependent methyltransferase [Neomicrococcus lactis]MBB5597138.1 SAM-dependent methyltransferase [Neomicrococcus lactis]